MQQQINNMAKDLRMAVIKKLLLTDLFKYSAAKTVDDAELAWRANEIFKMPISTGNLKSLFADCHDYCKEVGMFDGPVRVADLEFCVKKRSVGYRCSNEFKNNWLPRKEDVELRALPEFKKLAAVYMEAKKVIAPVEKSDETNLITAQILSHITRG